MNEWNTWKVYRYEFKCIFLLFIYRWIDSYMIIYSFVCCCFLNSVIHPIWFQMVFWKSIYLCAIWYLFEIHNTLTFKPEVWNFVFSLVYKHKFMMPLKMLKVKNSYIILWAVLLCKMLLASSWSASLSIYRGNLQSTWNASHAIAWRLLAQLKAMQFWMTLKPRAISIRNEFPQDFWGDTQFDQRCWIYVSNIVHMNKNHTS